MAEKPANWEDEVGCLLILQAMAAQPPKVVIEISSSSDEEEEDDGILLVGSSLSHKRNTEDSEVVLIAKVLCSDGRVMEKSTAGLKKAGDDDCCVLDGDPNKKALSLDIEPSDADDLVVVGETGPVACRDYPHARHLCVKYPFKTSSHESYCGQCHCYVCDVLAPCLLWGKGDLGGDHCHACDKDEKWKRLRSFVRVPPSKNGTIQPTPVHGTSRFQQARPQQRSHHTQSQPRVLVRPQPRGDIHFQPRSQVQTQRLRTFVQPIGGMTLHGTSVNNTNLSPSHLLGGLRPYHPSANNATRGHPRFPESQYVLPPTVPQMAPVVRMSVSPPGAPPNFNSGVFANIASYQAPTDTFAYRDACQSPNLQLYTEDGAYLRSRETSSSYSSTSMVELGVAPPKGNLQTSNPYCNLQNDSEALLGRVCVGILEQREQPIAKDGTCCSNVPTNLITTMPCMGTIVSDGRVQNQPVPTTPRRQSAELGPLIVPIHGFDTHIGSASGLNTPDVSTAGARQASSESSAQELLNFLNDGVASSPLDYNFPELDCNPLSGLDCTDFLFGD